MLKSNSKIVKQKIRDYIISWFHYCDFERDNAVDLVNFSDIATVILSDFKRVTDNDYYTRTMTKQDRFLDWLTGLPSMIDTDYFLGTDAARDLLADWLEESETEKNRFSETDAEKMIGRLLFRELTAAGRELTQSELVNMIDSKKER